MLDPHIHLETGGLTVQLVTSPDVEHWEEMLGGAWELRGKVGQGAERLRREVSASPELGELEDPESLLTYRLGTVGADNTAKPPGMWLPSRSDHLCQLQR